jgi:hypothetical protein
MTTEARTRWLVTCEDRNGEIEDYVVCRTPEEAQEQARAWIDEEDDDPCGWTIMVYRMEPETMSEKVWETVRYVALPDAEPAAHD